MATINGMVAASAVGIALSIGVAAAADSTVKASPQHAAASVPGSLPGDEALTCDQLYAQGMAETHNSQQARSRRNDEMRAQRGATAAMMTGAMMTGGMGGTGQAAQAAAERQADSQMALLGTPQSNPRMDRIKELWAQKHCAHK